MPSDSERTPPPPPRAPAPGWYQQPGTHEMRFWDGANWTEHVAPNPNTSNADNNEAAWPYWGALLLGFLPALILFFTKKDQPRTRANSAQVLNIEIVLTGIQLVGMFTWFAGFASALATIDENTTELPTSFGLFLLVWVVFFAIFAARLVVFIWLGVAATKGVDKTLRFVPKLIKP